MLRLIVACLVWPGAALAETWQMLSGAQIIEVLTSRLVVFPEGVAQDFLDDGRTVRPRG